MIYSFDLSNFEAGQFVATRYPDSIAVGGDWVCAADSVGGDWVCVADSDSQALALAERAAHEEWAAPESREWSDFSVKFVDLSALQAQRLASGLEIDADTSHESAEDMYDSLGNHWDWDDYEGHDGCVVHPVCTVDQLDTMTDAQILAAECPEPSCDEERSAYESAIEYARNALDDMRSIASELERAVEAYERGDADEVLDALRGARRAESDYGDWPAGRALADALIHAYPVDTQVTRS